MSKRRSARRIPLAVLLGVALCACSKSGTEASGSGGKSALAGGAGGMGVGGTGGKASGSGGSVVSTSAASGGVDASGGSQERGGAPGSGGAMGGAEAGVTGSLGSGAGGTARSSGGSSSAGGGAGGTTISTRDGGGSVNRTGGAGGSQDAGRGGAGGSAGAAGTTCSTSTLKSGNATRNLTIGGTNRSYILHVPSNYTGTKPVPLVLDFHGLGGSGSMEQSSSGYQAVADKEGFLIAFPNGIDSAWNIGPCCTNSRDVDDLGFAKGIVADVASAGCVDLQRVYSTGISMGGGMSHYLACNAADVFAAVAPAAFDLLVPEEQPCAPSRPIAVLAFRGTADTVVPYAGGKGSSGRVTFMGAQASFSRWAEIDGCVEPTTTEGECKYYKQCGDGVEVGLCVKQGGGHAGGDANVGWAFLSKFSLP